MLKLAPDGSFGPAVARNCMSLRLCIYSAPSCSKAWSVSMLFCTIKNP